MRGLGTKDLSESYGDAKSDFQAEANDARN